MFVGINNETFQSVFYTHLFLQLAAVLLSICFFASLLKGRTTWLALIATFFFIIIAVQGLLPITARDALIHHMAVPKWWIAADKIIEINWHHWSYYPMLVDLGFTGLMAEGLVDYVGLYHFSFLIMLSGLVANFVQRKFQDNLVAALGFVWCLTLPVCIRLASTPLVDLGLALYSMIAFIAIIQHLKQPESGFFPITAGVALGLGLGTKYNGLLMLLLFSIGAFYLLLKTEKTTFSALARTCLIGLLAIFVYFPWMLKNAIWTYNPFFPLFVKYLGPALAFPSAIKGLSPIAHRLIIYNESWLEVALLPLRVLFLGQDDNPQLFDGRLTPLLIFSIVPFFFFWRKLKIRPWLVFAYILVVGYFCCGTFLAAMRIRYMAPIFGPLIVLSCFGCLLIYKKISQKYQRYFIGTVILFELVWSLFYSVQLLTKSKALQYYFSKQTPEAYLRENVDEYALAEYVNSHLDKDSHLYLLYTGDRYYYYERSVVSAGYHSGNQMIAWIKSVSKADQLKNELHIRGIDYLVVHGPRLTVALNQTLDNEGKQIWNSFVSESLEPVYNLKNYTLFKIR